MSSKITLLAVSVVATCLFGACKSKESAYQEAYEKAKADESTEISTDATTTVTVPVQTPTVSVTPVQTTTTPSVTVSDADFRSIQGGFSVVSGEKLKTYSVVVGSFTVQTNAENLSKTLTAQGYSASILKTNETINGITGWYRVVATSFDDRESAVTSRDQLRRTYEGAWLLYAK